MKTIKAEILMIEGAPFPVIKEIYDPSNERRNGNITPEAPIVITGHNLDMLTWESTNLYHVYLQVCYRLRQDRPLSE